MSHHNKPDFNTPEIIAGLTAHGLEVETPSQTSDAFRFGYKYAQATGATVTAEILRDANKRRHEEWPNGDKIDLCFRALEMAGEAGELANKVKKLVRMNREITGTVEERETLMQEIADEMGDVVITVDLIGMELGIPFGDSIRAKFNKTSDKHGFKTRIGDG